jgi:hypothetical protein
MLRGVEHRVDVVQARPGHGADGIRTDVLQQWGVRAADGQGMSRVRRLAPELSAVLVGLGWGVLSAAPLDAGPWYPYRSGLGPQHAALLGAVALLGVALLRAGQRVAAVLVPVALALLPTAGDTTLAGGLLFPVGATDVPALWPYGDAVLQALVVAAPAVLGVVLGRRAWSARPLPILRATTRQVLARTGSVALAGIAAPLLGGAAESWGPADTGALGILLVVVVATGLLIASPQSLPMTTAQLAVGTVVLILVNLDGGLDRADLGDNDWGGVALGSLGYLAAVAVGPAAVLLAPSATRAWRRGFRRGPALASMR